MTITIHSGAFQNHIKKLPKGSVDLLVTDPPYLLDTQGGGAFAGKNLTYDAEFKGFSDGITNDDLDLIMSRMSQVNAYIWCNKAQLRQYLDYFDDIGCNFDVLTWHKSNPVPRCNNKYLSDTEYVVFARDKGVPLGGSYATLGKYWVTPINQKDKERYGHPTIKPLDIIRTLISNSSAPGDLVMDPFLGSGTTAVACVLEDRNFWGCELDPSYYQISMQRVAEAKSELRSGKKSTKTVQMGLDGVPLDKPIKPRPTVAAKKPKIKSKDKKPLIRRVGKR